MKPPRTPPPWKEATSSISPDRLMEALNALKFSAAIEGYWHWDDLRHHQPPGGITMKEWWLTLKVSRVTQYRFIKLRDLKGEHFRYFTSDSMLRTLHDIDMRAGGSIQMPEQVTNPETRDQYYVSSLMEEAITSSQLEGAVTTREIAKEMLRTNRQPRDLGERMILNNYLTMRKLAEWKAQPLTPELVFEIHRLITEGTLKDETAPGRFRTDKEQIQVEDEFGESLHVPPPARELPKRMKEMCDFANAPDEVHPFVHPVIRAIILHFWLAYDHPFKDGNGRTARALFYWLMLRRGFWLFEFLSISQFLKKAPAQYARSFLLTETDENDLNYFVLHQLKVICKAVDALHEYIDRKTRELRLISAALRNSGDLNHRQEALLSRAIRRPGTSFTIQSHRTSHDVAYDTARTDLDDLVTREFLVRRKRGKGFVFEASPDLESKLKSGGRR